MIPVDQAQGLVFIVGTPGPGASSTGIGTPGFNIWYNGSGNSYTGYLTAPYAIDGDRTANFTPVNLTDAVPEPSTPGNNDPRLCRRRLHGVSPEAHWCGSDGRLIKLTVLNRKPPPNRERFLLRSPLPSPSCCGRAPRHVLRESHWLRVCGFEHEVQE